MPESLKKKKRKKKGKKKSLFWAPYLFIYFKFHTFKLKPVIEIREAVKCFRNRNSHLCNNPPTTLPPPPSSPSSVPDPPPPPSCPAVRDPRPACGSCKNCADAKKETSVALRTNNDRHVSLCNVWGGGQNIAFCSAGMEREREMDRQRRGMFTEAEPEEQAESTTCSFPALLFAACPHTRVNKQLIETPNTPLFPLSFLALFLPLFTIHQRLDAKEASVQCRMFW